MGLVGSISGLALWVVWLGKPMRDRFAEPRPALVETRREPWESGEAVELIAADGLEIRLGVVRDTRHDLPRPVAVVLGGHRTGRGAIRLVGDPGPIAVVAVDYPYDGPDRIRGVRQALQEAPGMREALLNTPRAIFQAMDWVLTQPWADPQRIELVGVSLGVPFVAVAGASDARFSRVWLIQGAADNSVWIERNLRRKIGSAWLRHGATWTVHRLAHGSSFDTAEWIARIAPRPVVVVGASEDQSLPREQVEGLYAAAGEPRELIWVPGGHINPRRPETVRPILELVRARL